MSILCRIYYHIFVRQAIIHVLQVWQEIVGALLQVPVTSPQNGRCPKSSDWHLAFTSIIQQPTWPTISSRRPSLRILVMLCFAACAKKLLKWGESG